MVSLPRSGFVVYSKEHFKCPVEQLKNPVSEIPLWPALAGLPLRGVILEKVGQM